MAGIKGSIYEEKIIKEIKIKGKANRTEITKEQAEKILKDENEKNLNEKANLSNHDHSHDHSHKHGEENDKKKASSKKETLAKKAKSKAKKNKQTKKVSKK